VSLWHAVCIAHHYITDRHRHLLVALMQVAHKTDRYAPE
jgi:hypothetical protein